MPAIYGNERRQTNNNQEQPPNVSRHLRCLRNKKEQVYQEPERKRFFNDTINSLPFEMHIPGHNFTGPGTKLNKRLNADMTPKAWSKPINRVDKAAYHHDICYVKNKDTKTRNEVCDKNMLTELNGICNPTLRERMERGVVSTIIGTKKTLRMGVKKNERSESVNWRSQLADELHKPIIKNCPKRKCM